MKTVEDIVIVGRHAVKKRLFLAIQLIKFGYKRESESNKSMIFYKMLKSKIDCANSSKSKLDNLANAPHQGVAAYCTI